MSVGYSTCDYNSDNTVDILDIVGMSNCILTVGCFDGSQCDWNADGGLNILDVVSTANCILLPMGCNQDCVAEWGGSAVEDNCGTCDYDTTNDCIQDCAGVWGGEAVEDECGLCDGDGYLDCISITECENINICDESDCIVEDCFSVCGGGAVEDCHGFCGGSSELDLCGECGGDNSSCIIISDIDENQYGTVQIGDQLWMKQNLKATHYNNGDEIPTGYSDGEWIGLETGAYAVYDNNTANADIYGNLYNWYAVDDERGVCPEGWHVPSDEEYTVLTDYLGGTSVAGGKMKEEGYEHWNNPNTGATNESGFTALPGGYRGNYNGHYYNMGGIGYFWSSSMSSMGYPFNAWFRLLKYDSSSVNRVYSNKRFGYSIRCLGD